MAAPDAPQVAFKRGFHTMSEYDFCKALSEWLKSMPKCSWDELECDAMYMYEDYNNKQYAFTVLRITPSKAKIVVREYDDQDDEISYHAGSWKHRSFLKLDEEIRQMLGITHRAIVKAAVLDGLSVPPKVRCEYPEFFVGIPHRFERGKGHPAEQVFGSRTQEKYYSGPATAADRVREALQCSPYKGGPCTAAKINEWIDRAHKAIADVSCYYTRMDGNTSGGMDIDLNKLIAEFLMNIDFYRWLEPHVSEGGVFYISEIGVE